MNFHLTIYPVGYNADGEAYSGVTTLSPEEQREAIKNKHIVLMDEDELEDYINWRDSQKNRR